MIPLLFAATLATSNPWIEKDLRGPVRNPLDPPAAAPLSRDLRGPAPDPLSGPVRTWVLPVDAALPPGAIVSPSNLQLYSGRLCHQRTVQTLGPDHSALKKLGDLPPGLLEHAVNRLVNGCPVREIVYGGKTYYLDTQNAALERLDPVAHITKAPVEPH